MIDSSVLENNVVAPLGDTRGLIAEMGRMRNGSARSRTVPEARDRVKG